VSPTESALLNAVARASRSDLFEYANRTTVQRASEYFAAGAITSFRWTNGGDNLCAVVQGTKKYLVTLGIDRAGALQSDCTCPAAQGYRGICKHQLAVLVMVRLLVTGDCFGWFMMRGNRIDKLKKELMRGEAARKRAAGGEIEIVLQPGRNGELLVSLLSGGSPINPFHPRLEGYTHLLRELDVPWRRKQSVLQLLREKNLPGQIKVQCDGELHAVEVSTPVRMTEELELVCSEEAVTILRVHRALLDEDPRDWVAIGDHFFFSKSLQRIGIVESSADADLNPGRLSAAGLSFLGAVPDGDEEPDTVDLMEWNDGAIPLYGEDHASTFQLRAEGVPGLVEPSEAHPMILLELLALGDGRIEVRVLQSANGMLLPLPSLLLEELEMLLQGSPINTFRTKRRKQALWAHLSRNAFARTAKERRQAREEFLKTLRPDRPKSIDSPQDWLRHFEGRWIDGKEAGACLPLLVEEEAPHWFIAPGAARQALQVIALALSALDAEIVPDADSPRLIAFEQSLQQGLSVLLAGISAIEGDVVFEGSPIEQVSPEVKVEVGDSEHIDWFELRPEVRHQGELIPREQWERMLEGMPVQMDDGSWRLLVPEKALALEMLQEIFDSNSRGAASPATGNRLSRMHIFDWLAWKEAGIDCTLSPEARELVDSLRTLESLPQLPLPDNFKAELRPYQQQGYDWLGFHYRHRFGACLADDMGLGKTVQTIALLAAVQQGKVRKVGQTSERRPRHLLVLPPTLLYNWESEIERFTPDLEVGSYTGSKRNLRDLDVDVVLTTYELARRDADTLSKEKFDVIVFDEAQHVKNLNASRAQAMRAVSGEFKLCLTGTPLENHAGEFYAIMDLALPGLLGDPKRFLKRMKEGTADRVLQRSRPFLLRRTKDKILRELPEKVENDVFFDLSDEQKAYYTRAVAEVRSEVMEAYRGKPAQRAGIMALAALTRLRQICIDPGILDEAYNGSSPKIDHLLDNLTELHEEGHAALVFSQFTRGLDVLQKALADRDYPYLRLDGSTPQRQRRKLIDDFQKNGGPPVFLISRKTGGAGLNLTRASYVFHLDPWWNPAVENQATDRAHRIGQQQTVFVQRLLMRHTIEEKMMLLKERKKRLFDQVLSGQTDRDSSSLLTKEDFAFLLDT